MSQDKSMDSIGRFIGVGVGTGEPELVTIKALRLIKQAAAISFLINDKGESQAKNIATAALASMAWQPEASILIPIKIPMLVDRSKAKVAYDIGAQQISKILQQGQDVVFLCEGDPLVFGSFAYLLERLETSYNCLSVPGICSLNAAAARLVQPLMLQNSTLAVVSGRNNDSQILEALKRHDTVVILKAGQARAKILAVLATSGRLKEARYLEYIGRDNEKVVTDVEKLKPESGSYFSMFLVSKLDNSSGAEAI